EMVRPYGAWIDALRSAAPATIEPALRADLAPLLPELGDGRADLGDRTRLFDAVAHLLRGLAERTRPVAVLLDAVQWFDEASAALLHFVARAAVGSGVLVACAARSVETTDNRATVGVARALRRDGHLDDLPLERLDDAAIRQIAQLIDARVDVERVCGE